LPVFSITFGLIIESAASEMVAIGVLNSWVILLIKSVFTSEIFFCFNIIKTLIENAIRIIRLKNNEAGNIIDNERYKCVFLSGK